MDGLAPAWELLINGRERLPPGYRALIRSVKVDATIDGAAELEIEADAWDPVDQVFRFLGESILAPGNRVVVRMGYGSELTTIQRFRIVREEAAYPSGSTPTVKIAGYSAEAELGEDKAARTWANPSTDSEIVREIAEAHGLAVTSDSLEDTPERKVARVKAKGTSDLAFLQALAAANGYGPPVIRYDEDSGADVLYFRPLKLDKSAALTLIYNPFLAGSSLDSGNLVDFSPVLDLHGVPTAIEVVGWDKVNQEAIVVIMKIEDGGQDPTILKGAAAAAYRVKSGSEMRARALKDGDDVGTIPTKPKRGAKAAKVETTVVPHLETVEDAVAWATRWILTRNAAFFTSRATTLGIPTLWIGQVHDIQGVAASHAGLWLLTGVSHTMDASGYQCDLDLERVLEEAAAPQEG